MVYLCGAEASPDAQHDGEVAGSAVGVLIEKDGVVTARYAIMKVRSDEQIRDMMAAIGRVWISYYVVLDMRYVICYVSSHVRSEMRDVTCVM